MKNKIRTIKVKRGAAILGGLLALTLWSYGSRPLRVVEATSLSTEELTIGDRSGLGLPAAATGCRPTGVPSNLWIDPTSGVEWCVVAEEEVNGETYAMLVSRYAHRLIGIDGINNTRYHSSNVFIPWGGNVENPHGPEVKGRVNLWFDVNSSDELRASVVDGTVPTLNDFLTVDDSIARRNDTTALSAPVSGTLGSNKAPFFMSEADLNVRLGTSEPARQTTHVNGDNAAYWLRSGGNTPRSISIVNIPGAWNALHANSVLEVVGIRPAIWVRR